VESQLRPTSVRKDTNTPPALAVWSVTFGLLHDSQ